MLEISVSNPNPTFAEFYYHNRKIETTSSYRSADLPQPNEAAFPILEAM